VLDEFIHECSAMAATRYGVMMLRHTTCGENAATWDRLEETKAHATR